MTKTSNITGERTPYRLVRADDFVAEHLENEASRIPPSMAERAAILREQARLLRQSSSTAMIRVWEEGG